MTDWFIWLLFGHLFGDYMFQNAWMAFNKDKDYRPLVVHCVLYTIIVCLFLMLGAKLDLAWWHWVLIFLSHIVLDGTKFVKWWCNFYGIRSWDTYLPRTYEDIDFAAPAKVSDTVTTSFGAIVSVVIDNTLHLFMMFFMIKYMVL